MGFKVNFTDNQNVSGDDLSATAKSIDATKNAVFSDNILYGVADLNDISKALISSGVSYGLDISLSGVNVKIASGVGFFADGKKIEVDSDGIELPFEPNEKNYVWLSNDQVLGTVSAKCTTTLPEGDYIRLGEISEGGEATPKKDKACMKNSSLMPNYYERISYHFRVEMVQGGTPFSVDLGKDFRRMVILGTDHLAYINFDENKLVRSRGSNGIEESEIFGVLITIKPYLNIKIEAYENNILHFRAYCSTLHGSEVADLVLECM